MAATQIGAVHIEGLAGGALGIASISGYISPNLQTLRIGHSGNVSKIKNQAGQIASLLANDQSIECQFEFIPEGTSGANAKKSAFIPDLLAGVTITGLPIIQIGVFADALNTNGSSTQPWIYEGDGSVTGQCDGHWTETVTLRRYPQITSATALS